MVIAADYPFLDVVFSILVFFGFVAWMWMVFSVLGDVFGRRDASGWVKAAWAIFVVVLPFLGVLVYLIAHSDDMNRRRLESAQAAIEHFDDHVRAVAGSSGPAAEIERAKGLLDSGSITGAEFASIKAKALA